MFCLPFPELRDGFSHKRLLRCKSCHFYLQFWQDSIFSNNKFSVVTVAGWKVIKLQYYSLEVCGVVGEFNNQWEKFWFVLLIHLHVAQTIKTSIKQCR